MNLRQNFLSSSATVSFTTGILLKGVSWVIMPFALHCSTLYSAASRFLRRKLYFASSCVLAFFEAGRLENRALITLLCRGALHSFTARHIPGGKKIVPFSPVGTETGQRVGCPRHAEVAAGAATFLVRMYVVTADKKCRDSRCAVAVNVAAQSVCFCSTDGNVSSS